MNTNNIEALQILSQDKQALASLVLARNEKRGLFLTELDAKLKDDDKIWSLDSPLLYYSSLLDTLIMLPTAFLSDGSSVPRVPIIYYLYGNRAHREGFIHDYLFRKNSIPIVPFDIANKVFLEAMISRNKPVYVRNPMYWAVSSPLARSSYHKHIVEANLDEMIKALHGKRS